MVTGARRLGVVRVPPERLRSVPSVNRGVRQREIGILLPNNQRQHRTLYIQKDVLPYALC